MRERQNENGLEKVEEKVIGLPTDGVSPSSSTISTIVGQSPAQDRQPSLLLLIDAKPMTREANAVCLANQLSDLMVIPLASVNAAMQTADRRSSTDDGPAVILFNIGAGSVADPRVADDLSRLADGLPNVPVIIISEREDAEAIADALESGVRGYVPTSITMPVMVGAIRLVQAGGTFAPPDALLASGRRNAFGLTIRTTPGHESVPGFSQRQLQVLACLREGMPNKVIAHELAMCESTVKVHVRHIMRKLRATNRTRVAFLTSGLFADQDTPCPLGKEE